MNLKTCYSFCVYVLYAFMCLFSGLTFSQTYNFSNNAASSFTNATAQTKTISVSGVPAGKILRQVNLKFGDGAMYSGDLTRAVITLVNPGGTTVTLLNQASFNNSSTITDADRKYINITLRDHAELHTPGGYASTTGNTVSNAYPYNFGYWRVPVAGSYGNFTGGHDGTWTLTISFPGLSSTYARKYVSAELVFGDPFVFEDIRNTKPNQSCNSKYCLPNEKIILGNNTGYPNPQAAMPLPAELVGGGCSNWNAEKNNVAWFKFKAANSTVILSISGMSNKQESIVIRTTTTDCCSNFSLVNGGCFSSMYSSTPSFDKYFKQNYASGYSQNHGYTLTGLTVGEEYILIIDGSSGSQSNFYIEAIGVDEECSSTTSAPIVNDPTQTFCGNPVPTVANLQPNNSNYSWYPSSNGGSPLAPSTPLVNGNTYYVQDNSACNSDRTPVVVSISNPTEPTVAVTQPTCAMPTGTITVSNPTGTGISYTLTGITPPAAPQTNTIGTFAGLASGTYQVTTSQDGCTSAPVNVTVNTQPTGLTEPTVAVTQPTCAMPTGTITVSNPTGTGISYSLTGITPPETPQTNTIGTFAGLASGTYHIAASQDGCTSAPVNVTVNTQPTGLTEPTVTVTQPTCTTPTGTITVSNPTGTGISYTLTGITPPAAPQTNTIGTFAGLASGTYQVTASQDGCTSAPVNVTVNTQPTGLTNPTVDVIQPTCATPTGTITVSNPTGTGISYTLTGITPPAAPQTNTIGTFAGLASGTYQVTASQDGCTSAPRNVIVNAQPTSPTVTVGTITNASCNSANGSVNIAVSGGIPPYAFDWSNGASAQNLSNLSAGTYTVVVTDLNGCSESTQIIITENGTTPLTINSDMTSGCSPVKVTFISSILDAETYFWDFGDGTTSNQTSPTHTFNGDSCYAVSLTATYANGCSYTANLDSLICVHPSPTAVFTASTNEITNIMSEVLFSNQSQNATAYEWYFGDETGYSTETDPKYVYNPTIIRNYTVVLVAENEFGCTDTARAVIHMKEDFVFYVPNTFTPDGDELNHVFRPVISEGFDAFDYEMQIFNRWGELIFETHDPAAGWNGTYLGGICQDGTYIWLIRTKKTSVGEKIVKSGHVTLLR